MKIRGLSLCDCVKKKRKKHKLTMYNRVLLEKLLVTHLVKKFPPFYGARRFITVFTRAHHWSLS